MEITITTNQNCCVVVCLLVNTLNGLRTEGGDYKTVFSLMFYC